MEILQISHNSFNRTWESCPRKFEFRKLFNSSGYTASLAGDAGNALHAGIQYYLMTGDVDSAVWRFMQDYPISLCKSVSDQRSLQACYATLLAMIDAKGFEQYTLATIMHKGINKPAVEVPFAIDIKRADGTDFTVSLQDGRQFRLQYVGYMDLVLYDAFADTYIVCDVKTTRKRRDDFTAYYKYDPQCLPYALILERILGRPFDRLVVKYLAAYIDIAHPTAHMYTFPKTRTDVMEWGQDLAIKLRELALYAELAWFPRRGLACDTFNVCPHFDYCDEREPHAINEYLELSRTPNTKERPPFEPWFEMDLVLEGL